MHVGWHAAGWSSAQPRRCAISRPSLLTAGFTVPVSRAKLDPLRRRAGLDRLAGALGSGRAAPINDPLQLIGLASLVGNSRETFHWSGTDGSNPVRSSGESPRLARFCPPTATSRLFARVCGPDRCSAVSRDGYRAVHGADRREYLCRAKFQYRGVDAAVA